MLKYLGTSFSGDLAELDSIPEFMTLGSFDGKVRVETQDNNLAGLYRVDTTTLYPGVLYRLTCSFNLEIIETSAIVFNSTEELEVAFSFAKFEKPKEILCIDEDWVYDLP